MIHVRICELLLNFFVSVIDNDCNPCPDGCSSCQEPDAYCVSCQPGFNGDQCQDMCPEGCNEVTTGSKCTTQNNQIICVNGCKPLYYDTDCKPCGSKCVTCDNSGICAQCNVGFYGSTCANTCSHTCGGNGECSFIQNILTCNHGCDQGYYGDACNKTCQNNCKNICERQTGKCLGCVSGFYGDMCDQRCEHCSNDDTCFQNNGTCVHGCDNGYYGDVCLQTCPSFCSNGECQRQTGKCVSCVSTYFSDTCDKRCEHCSGDKTCFQYNGTCVHGCDIGYYGSECNQQCPQMCASDCHRTTGECTSCVPGNYGNNCQLSCSSNCDGPKSCEQSDGNCTHGCVTGYLPPACTVSEYSFIIILCRVQNKRSVLTITSYFLPINAWF